MNDFIFRDLVQVCKRLMIGDWVSVIANDDNHKVICRVTGICQDFAYVKFPDSSHRVIDYHAIYPVKLTMDIIRNNDMFYPINERLMACEDSNFCIAQVTEDLNTYGPELRIGRLDFRYCIDHDDYVDTNGLLNNFMLFSRHCDFVHELQNAMRVYSLDTAVYADEIELS